METVRSLSGPVPTPRVHDRSGGGNKQQADAFRRALQGEAKNREATAEAEQEGSVRTGLQHREPIGRREAENAHHVDVIA